MRLPPANPARASRHRGQPEGSVGLQPGHDDTVQPENALDAALADDRAEIGKAIGAMIADAAR